MNSSNKAIYPLVGSLLVVIGIFLGIFLSDGKKTDARTSGKYEQKLADIIKILDKEYVDSIDTKQLFEKTITDLLHGLDPHSNYIAAEDLAAMSEGIQGKFGGVGIRFTIYRSEEHTSELQSRPHLVCRLLLEKKKKKKKIKLK